MSTKAWAKLTGQSLWREKTFKSTGTSSISKDVEVAEVAAMLVKS